MNEGGTVIDKDGIVHENGYIEQVSFNGTLSLILRPNSGFQLDTVTWNEQFVPVSNGRVELKQVMQDGKLVITWKQDTKIPTKKTYTIVGTVTENGSPANAVTLELRSKLKTFVTGSDGKFRFDEVESGAHSLTALRNGIVVGYLTFTLEEGGEGVNVTALPDGTFELRINESMATLQLDLSIQKDGTMEITNAKDITEQQGEETFPPATGDHSMIISWVIIMLISGTFLCYLVNLRRKTKRS